MPYITVNEKNYDSLKYSEVQSQIAANKVFERSEFAKMTDEQLSAYNNICQMNTKTLQSDADKRLNARHLELTNDEIENRILAFEKRVVESATAGAWLTAARLGTTDEAIEVLVKRGTLQAGGLGEPRLYRLR